MLRMPQTNEAANAMMAEPSIAWLRAVKSCSMTYGWFVAGWLFVASINPGLFVEVVNAISLRDCTRGQHAPPAPSPLWRAAPLLTEDSAANTSSNKQARAIWVLRFITGLANSLALAEFARLGNLFRRELHFVAQGLCNRDLPPGHGRPSIQPLLEVGFVHEEGLFKAAP